MAGETPLQAALREVKEELGIDLKPDNERLLCRGVRFYDGCDDFVDVWMFGADSKAIRKSLKLQVEEVNAAALVPPDVICFLRATDHWISWEQFDYLESVIGPITTEASEKTYKFTA